MSHRVVLMTRAGCTLCEKAGALLAGLADEFGFELLCTDVDAAAAAGDPSLRAEYGDLLPVVLLDGVQHSYWEVDEPRLREDLGTRRAGA
ncbi:glutaredoxin family protein [Mycolicibacterium hodleri]|nr:glutaredoxin family protein [Mycolicibacterium hodleri]